MSVSRGGGEGGGEGEARERGGAEGRGVSWPAAAPPRAVPAPAHARGSQPEESKAVAGSSRV